MEGSSRRAGRGYLGWHEQLLTEKQDPLVTIATLVLPILVCACVFTAYLCNNLISLQKESPGCGLFVDWDNLKDTGLFLTTQLYIYMKIVKTEACLLLLFIPLCETRLM